MDSLMPFLATLTRSAMKRTVTAFSTMEALFSDVDTSTVIAAVIIIPYTTRRPMPNAL